MSFTERREFLRTGLLLTTGALAGALCGCGGRDAARKGKGKGDDKSKDDDRVTEFCAKEPLGDGGGWFHYVGIGCPGAFPCTHSSPSPLSWPCNCGDAGCVSIGSQLRSADFELKSRDASALNLCKPPADAGKLVYWKADEDFKFAKDIAGRAEIVHKEVCELKVPGADKPRKVKIFVIKARYTVKNKDDTSLTTALGFEIDPAEDIARHTPKTYDGAMKMAHVASVPKHPSNQEFTVFLKNQ